MAKIWQDVEIVWEGVTHKFRPTLAFINSLEQDKGHSLSAVFIRMTQGDLPSGTACSIIHKALMFAGVEDLSPEDVFEATGGGIGVDTVTTVQTILVACMPEPKQPVAKKKPQATEAKT